MRVDVSTHRQDHARNGANVPLRSPPGAVSRGAFLGGLLAMLVFALLLSGGSPSALIARGPYTSDFFDAQAAALYSGQLAVNPLVPAIEGFVHDGETHLYFGLLPALLRLPVVLFTDRLSGRLTALSMLIALAVLLWAGHRILWYARLRAWGERPHGRHEPWVAAAFVATLGCSSPLLFLSARPIVYHEVALWGVATTLLATVAILRWWAAPSVASLAVAAAAVTAAMNTRASVGSGATTALLLTGALALFWRRVDRRYVVWLALAMAIPVGTYAAVNQARFGHPFSVPFEKQVHSRFDARRKATLEATGNSLFGSEFAPTAILTYLRPDGVRFQKLFPWVTFREPTAVLGDPVFDTVDRAASVPAVAPALLLLAIVGTGVLLRDRRRDPWLVLAAGTATGLASTVTIAFIANRYLADFTPPLVVLAAVGAWPVATWALARTPRRRRLAVAGLTALALAGTWVGAALAIQAKHLFIMPRANDRLSFIALQYDIHARLSSGPPPRLRWVEQVRGLAGERGDVAAQAECEGLYWHDGKRWWPLELGRPLRWDLTGSLARRSATLVSTPQWALVSTMRNEKVHIEYRRRNKVVQSGRQVRLEDADGSNVTVLLDPVNAEALIEIGGIRVFRAWPVGLGGSARVGPGWTTAPVSTPLCDRLVRRIDH